MRYSATNGGNAVTTTDPSKDWKSRSAAWYRDWRNLAVTCTLKQYLELYQHHGDPRGDFARDGLEDASFPAAAKSWETVEGYLLSRRACPEALEAGRQIWRAYVRDMAQSGDEALAVAWEHERCLGSVAAPEIG
jgi:hypothetical protein